MASDRLSVEGAAFAVEEMQIREKIMLARVGLKKALILC